MTPEVSSAKGSHPTSLGWLDAVVVIVSEETGVISVAVGGILKRHLAPKTLERLLRNELCHEQEAQNENLVVKLRQKLLNEKGGKQK